MAKSISLSIGLKELTFLAALLDGDSLLGVEDPFLGWLAHQVEEEWGRLAPEMEADRLFSRSPDGEIVVEPEIAKMIKACCFPAGCVMLSHWQKAGGATTHAYYLTPEIIIEKVDLEPSFNCKLSVLQNPAEVVEKIRNILPSTSDLDNSKQGGEVPASVIESIKNQEATDRDTSLTLLSERYPNFKKPDIFVDNLVKPVSYSILILANLKEGDYKTNGFSLLEGEKGLWKMRAFNKKEEEWLEINSCNKSDLEKEFEKIKRYILELIDNKNMKGK